MLKPRRLSLIDFQRPPIDAAAMDRIALIRDRFARDDRFREQERQRRTQEAEEAQRRQLEGDRELLRLTRGDTDPVLLTLAREGFFPDPDEIDAEFDPLFDRFLNRTHDPRRETGDSLLGGGQDDTLLGGAGSDSLQTGGRQNEKGESGSADTQANEAAPQAGSDESDFDSELDALQLGISVVGQAPAVGILADLLNAGISAFRGNFRDAALDLGAAIPVFGNAIGAARAAKTAGKFLDPNKVRFSQPTVSKNFSERGTIDDLVEGLRSGAVKPGDVPPIRVVDIEGQDVTLDNRRLVAFNLAGKEVPFKRVSNTDPDVAREINRKLKPIADGRVIWVLEKASLRNAALKALKEKGMIE